MMPMNGPMDEADARRLGVLELAHVGDAVYELLVRTYLARQGAARVGELHRRAVAYVAAPAQAAAMQRLLPALTDGEYALYRRGRNARVHGCPAGCSAAQYHAATALEVLFGYLWLMGRIGRVQELFTLILEEDHAS